MTDTNTATAPAQGVNSELPKFAGTIIPKELYRERKRVQIVRDLPYVEKGKVNVRKHEGTNKNNEKYGAYIVDMEHHPEERPVMIFLEDAVQNGMAVEVENGYQWAVSELGYQPSAGEGQPAKWLL